MISAARILLSSKAKLSSLRSVQPRQMKMTNRELPFVPGQRSGFFLMRGLWLISLLFSLSDSGGSKPISLCEIRILQTKVRQCEISRARLLCLQRLRGGSQHDSFQNAESAVLDFNSETRDSIIEDHAHGQSHNSMFEATPRSPAEEEQLNEEARSLQIPFLKITN